MCKAKLFKESCGRSDLAHQRPDGVSWYRRDGARQVRAVEVIHHHVEEAVDVVVSRVENPD
jgi:hypothetical protein